MATPLYCFLLVSFRAAKTWFKFVPFVSAKSSFGDSGDWWATWVAWGYCHCSICRQLSGAPFSCQALFDAEEVGPTDLYLRSPWPTSYLLLLSDWQIYMWNLRTVPQSSCELVFPIPGSDVAWTWCEPHFFANIQRTGCIGCNLHLFPSMLPIYIYLQIRAIIFIAPGVERMRCASCMAPVRGLVLGGKVAAIPLGLLCSWRTGTESPLRFAMRVPSGSLRTISFFGSFFARPMHHLYYANRVMDLRPDSWDGLQFQSSSDLFHVIFIDFDSAKYAQVMVCQSMLDHCARRSFLKVNGETVRLRPVKPVKNIVKQLNVVKLVRLLEAKIYVAGWCWDVKPKRHERHSVPVLRRIKGLKLNCTDSSWFLADQFEECFTAARSWIWLDGPLVERSALLHS